MFVKILMMCRYCNHSLLHSLGESIRYLPILGSFFIELVLRITFLFTILLINEGTGAITRYVHIFKFFKKQKKLPIFTALFKNVKVLKYFLGHSIEYVV